MGYPGLGRVGLMSRGRLWRALHGVTCITPGIYLKKLSRRFNVAQRAIERSKGEKPRSLRRRSSKAKHCHISGLCVDRVVDLDISKCCLSLWIRLLR